jgi:cellulose synthase (UDP-forming)/endoglucanase
MRLVTAYDTAGAPLTTRESPTFYACALPSLSRQDPARGRAVRLAHLNQAQLSRLARRQDRYYDANWVWFGIALADGWIPTQRP